MKAVIISDIHIGKIKYGKLNPDTGMDFRAEDILNNIKQAVDFALKKKVEAFFILGDIYHNKKPPQQFREAFVNSIKKVLEEESITTFIVLGNHDQGKTHSNDLIELGEVSHLIGNLYVIRDPIWVKFEDSYLAFLPHVNKIEHNLSDENYYDFNLSQIKLLSEKALKDDSKYKYFFGHFGTDHSTFGNSFDLGTITGKKTRFVPLDSFDKKVWTKVYLGDIHQHQEMNDFCRHVGSIARVDFGEENEYKGFYYLDGEVETFQTISDREFRTLEVDLMEDPRATMEQFCSNVQEMDLSSSIVRLKVKMKDKDRALVGFDGIENFLMQESWNYIGKTITAVKETEDIKIDVNADFDYVKIFDKFTSAVKEDRKIPEDVFKSVTEEGKRILSEILNQ